MEKFYIARVSKIEIEINLTNFLTLPYTYIYTYNNTYIH